MLVWLPLLGLSYQQRNVSRWQGRVPFNPLLRPSKSLRERNITLSLSLSHPFCSSIERLISHRSIVKMNQKDHTALYTSFQKSFVESFNPTPCIDERKIATEQQRRGIVQRFYRRLNRLVSEWWLWEIISWSISGICLCAIAILLGVFDGKTLPTRWPGGISLNAYISILSTMAKSSMAIPIYEGLGQLKWSWFKSDRPRRLTDFEWFDNASKGPWGALTLITSGSGRSVSQQPSSHFGTLLTFLDLWLSLAQQSLF